MVQACCPSSIRICLDPVFRTLVQLVFVLTVVISMIFLYALFRDAYMPSISFEDACVTLPSMPTFNWTYAFELIYRLFLRTRSALTVFHLACLL